MVAQNAIFIQTKRYWTSSWGPSRAALLATIRNSLCNLTWCTKPWCTCNTKVVVKWYKWHPIFLSLSKSKSQDQDFVKNMHHPSPIITVISESFKGWLQFRAVVFSRIAFINGLTLNFIIFWNICISLEKVGSLIEPKWAASIQRYPAPTWYPAVHHTFTHSTVGNFWQPHWEQFRVRCLAQGDFKHLDWTSQDLNHQPFDHQFSAHSINGGTAAHKVLFIHVRLKPHW